MSEERDFEEMWEKANEYYAELEKREKELETQFNLGVLEGIKLMQNRMLLACENGTPINIEGKAYFIKSDIQNLHDIFADLEADTE